MSDFFREGKENTEELCSNKLNDLQSRQAIPEEGEFSYIYFYNIKNGQNLFEEDRAREEEEDSFTHSCEILSEDTYDEYKIL